MAVVFTTISSSLRWISQNSFSERPLCFVWKLFKSFNDFMLILDQNFKTDNIKKYDWIYYSFFLMQFGDSHCPFYGHDNLQKDNNY